MAQRAAARDAKEAAPAPAAAAEEPEAPAPAAVAEPAPPAPAAAPPAEPAEERRSPVREAMRSGDELDRLMATAVVESRVASGRPAIPADRRAPDVESPKPAGRARAEAALAKEPPLGRDAIQTVMKDVQKKMNDCYRRHGQQGAADVRVEVSPDGTVAGSVVRGMLANTPTAGCVESKLKEAAFPASGGITFNYRLMVK